MPAAAKRPATITNITNPAAPTHRQAPKWSIRNCPTFSETPNSRLVQQVVATTAAKVNWRRSAPRKPQVV